MPSVRTAVSISVELLGHLDAWCARTGEPRSAVLREMLGRWVAAPRMVEVRPGPRVRVQVRLPADLVARWDRERAALVVSRAAVVDSMVRALVDRPRPAVVDPRYPR